MNSATTLSISIVSHINRRIPVVRANLEAEDRERTGGGYICIARFTPELRTDDGLDLIALVAVGELEKHPERASFRRNAYEKAHRLSYHPEHRTSWQSRCADARRYGGGIRLLTEDILSFSGFPERWDEALVLDAAYQNGRIGENEMFSLADPTTHEPLKILLAA